MKKTIILAVLTAVFAIANATEVRTLLPSQRLSTGPTTATYNADGKLDVPEFLPFTEVSTNGFTANWAPVDGADGYSFYTYLFHTAQADEEYALLDTKFDLYNAGYDLTIDSPLTYKQLGYDGYLDGIIERSDWKAYMPLLANGYLGLDNALQRNGLKGKMESPVYDLSSGGGDVHFRIHCMGEGVTKFSVNLSNYHELQRDSETGIISTQTLVDQQIIEVSSTWTVYEVTLHNATTSSIIDIQAEEGSGRLWLKEFKVSISLQQGELVSMPYVYRQGEDMTGCSIVVNTADYSKGDAYACKIACFENDDNGDAVYDTSSDFSDFSYVPSAEGSVREITASSDVRVMNTTDGVRIECNNPEAVAIYNLSGRVVYNTAAAATSHDIPLSKGLYIARVGSTTLKIAK